MTRHGRVPPGARAARLSLRHRLPGWMRLARRVVRSRTLIVAEALGLAAVLALFTAVPQVGAGNPAGLRRLLDEYPRWAAILHGAGLDAILHTRWFLGLIALCTATLWLVLEDQWSRAIRLWRQRLTPESFRNAPYRHEVWRGLPSGERGAPRIEIDTRGRLGLFGTPLFHLGLLLVIVAGLFRAAFGRDAAVELIEGETLHARASAWGRQWGGPLSRPLALPVPLQFWRLDASFYGSGAPQRLAADVRLLQPDGVQAARIGVNAPAQLGDNRVYVEETYGPAVLAVAAEAGRQEGAWTVLRHVGGDAGFEGSGDYVGELHVRIRSGPLREGVPQRYEVRLLRRNALLFAGAIAIGESVELAPGLRFRLQEARYWAEFRAARDQSLWLAYLGFFFLTAGAVIIFGVIRIDTLVEVQPEHGRERVVLALRAQRFAPLQGDRFAALVRAQTTENED